MIRSLRSVSTLCIRSIQNFPSAADPVSVDQREVQRFDELSSEWADEDGPFQALHSLNRLRIPWILNNLPRDKSQPHVLDVGSGGGVLSIPLARSGIHVTGIDASREAVDAAREALKTRPLQASGIAERLRFEWTSVEEFAHRPENQQSFDAVVASEIVEHVADVRSFVKSFSSLARPGAPIFVTTINKTWLSRLAAVWLAEEVLRIVPSGVHDWEKFVSPETLAACLEDSGCSVRAIQGFTYNPINNSWSWIPSCQVNYGILAIKN